MCRLQSAHLQKCRNGIIAYWFGHSAWWCSLPPGTIVTLFLDCEHVASQNDPFSKLVPTSAEQHCWAATCLTDQHLKISTYFILKLYESIFFIIIMTMCKEMAIGSCQLVLRLVAGCCFQSKSLVKPTVDYLPSTKLQSDRVSN